MQNAWTDIISDFFDLTSHTASPEAFRLWAGISLVAGACERRVWLRTKIGVAFPNLYVMLVAPPGVGKYVIEGVRDLWADAEAPGTGKPAFRVSPNSVTKASLMDALDKASNVIPLASPAQLTYHSLCVAAEEMGVLMPGYDLEFIGALNYIYNNPKVYDEARRASNVKALSIGYPQLNLLLGVQPQWLGSVFPEEAWSSGMASRLNMIYASAGPRGSLLGRAPSFESERKRILSALGRVSQIWGEADFAEGVLEEIEAWHQDGGPPIPSHSKLQSYNNRRTLHALKLCLISTVSRTGRLLIEKEDWLRAQNWMVTSEALMPDIFRAMVGRSDVQVVEELHFYITGLWTKGGQKPVSVMSLRHFLQQRVPTDKIERILESAIGAGIIAQVAGMDAFVPRPRHEHGVE